MEPDEKQVEALAKKLYETWMSPEEFQLVHGREKPAFRVEGVPWDRFPDIEIAEHQRDDFRAQARRLLSDPGLSIQVVTV